MAAKKTRSKSTNKKKPVRGRKQAARGKTKPAKVVKKAAKKKAAPRKAARARAATQVAETAGDVRVEQIQRLIEVMVASGAVEVEWRGEREKLRVRLKEDAAPTMVSYSPQVMPQPAPAPGAAMVPPSGGSAPAAVSPVEAAPAGDVFHSPMVGTFYGSPSPDAEPFVSVGDRVDADTTLCILEAMKVMNEIKAEIAGSIVEVLAQNGQPVEFGQPLFVIKRD